MIKKSHYLFTFFLVLFLSNFGFANINNNWNDKVSSRLIQEFKKKPKVDILVYFRDQADTKLLKDRMSKLEKSQQLLDKLKAKSNSTQKDVVTLLERYNFKFKQYFVVNAIAVSNADFKIVNYLSDKFEVAYIAYDSPVKDQLYAEDESLFIPEEKKETWGIKMIKANSVWELGIKGNGATVGGQDTGYDWTHPALNSKYRGYVNDSTGNHNYNWHDAIHDISLLHNDSIIDPSNNPCGLNSTVPCDDHSHGTHTMGTMVGENENNSFGVAPEANWIGCRNMERGWGKPSTYIECFEWFMAPTDINGQNPNPALAPDVINNSWGCPVSEGCDSTNWQFMELALDNLRNSGVFVVVSAGNKGIKRCGSVQDPAAIFENSFAVGSTRFLYDSTGLKFNDTISGFSSRGPVLVDGSRRLKPDITAPGSGVYSCVPGNGYRYSSGTSMAGPHVAGVVALMISANPKLRGQVDSIEKILVESAVPKYDIDTCRGIYEPVLPNTTYGYGRINALEAVLRAQNFKVSTEEELLSNNDFIIYPNPFSNTININHIANIDRLNLSIFDFMGKKVFEQNNSLNKSFDLSNLKNGIYNLKIMFNNRIVTKKIIKL